MSANQKTDSPGEEPPAEWTEEQSVPQSEAPQEEIIQDEPAQEELMVPEEEAAPQSDVILDAQPVYDENADESGESAQILESCPSCGTLMNVTDQAPFSEVFCPSCGQRLRARKHFNNFTLQQLLGEGGMGAVFKGLDNNLNRNVALKILKKECSANSEERAKLEKEACVTATINHPHVVKVFSFGDDHGQFYLAMELVEKGSLDDLMAIQHRVAEAQILEVGIQVAQGLDAALERGLIHRDIKPGNILFANAHTAKLVDFGLAIIMDEEAQSRGEIWGTPYYIAPEKLDNQPEDYRSDIYSLGGTLFHAIAGRPPYEALTASMVALKQLKSQPVSLQAFAPDVSSETAYVINRMLAKNPGDRYQSYTELVEHLSYARQKLLERSEKPRKPKERVVLETKETRSITAILSIGVLLAVAIIGVLLYVFRDRIFHTDAADATQQSASLYSNADVNKLFLGAVQMIAGGQYDQAAGECKRILGLTEISQPAKNWLLINEGLADLLSGDSDSAMSVFQEIQSAGMYTTDGAEGLRSNFFMEATRLMTKDKNITGSTTKLYSPSNYEAFGLFAFGIYDWRRGDFDDAAQLLQAYAGSQPAAPEDWISSYKPLAAKFLSLYQAFSPIETAFAKVSDPADATALLKQIKDIRSKVPTGDSLSDKLDVMEKTLVSKGGTKP